VDRFEATCQSLSQPRKNALDLLRICRDRDVEAEIMWASAPALCLKVTHSDLLGFRIEALNHNVICDRIGGIA
jgi:hypothetical protein